MHQYTIFLPLAQLGAPAPLPPNPAQTSPAAATGPTPAVGPVVTPAATGVAPAATAAAGTMAGTPLPEVGIPGLTPPADLNITVSGTSELVLTWKDTATAETGYKVYRTTDGQKYELVKELPKDATTFTDSGLAANTGYGYKVVPFNTVGDGSPAIKEARTSASFFASYGQIILIVVVFAALYLFLFRGQRKQEKKRKEMVNELKKGDRVMTIGGMVARVVSIDGEEVVLKIDESANVKATYRKSAIQEVLDRDEKK